MTQTCNGLHPLGGVDYIKRWEKGDSRKKAALYLDVNSVSPLVLNSYLACHAILLLFDNQEACYGVQKTPPLLTEYGAVSCLFKVHFLVILSNAG